MPLIRMTYAYPERIETVEAEGGRQVKQRVPGSPTRPARAWEANGWWEEASPADALLAEASGATVRWG